MSITKYAKQITGVNTNAILGHVLWFTVSANEVPIVDAVTAAQNAGLTQAHLRTELRPIDAFRKASKEIENRFPKNEQGFRSNFLVRSVGQDSDTSHRHVVLERARTEKGKKRRLLYQTVAELVFWRGTKKKGQYSGYHVDVNKKDTSMISMTTQEEDWLDIHLNGFVDRFRYNLEHLDSNAIRQFVRDTLSKSMKAVCVKRSGGVYYVQHSYSNDVKALSQFMQTVGSDFHDLPLVDLDEQREMVLEAFQNETVDDLRRASIEVHDILSDPNRTIRQATFDEKVKWASELLGKADEIESTLDRKADLVRTEVGLFRQQLLSLTSRVEEPS